MSGIRNTNKISILEIVMKLDFNDKIYQIFFISESEIIDYYF